MERVRSSESSRGRRNPYPIKIVAENTAIGIPRSEICQTWLREPPTEARTSRQQMASVMNSEKGGTVAHWVVKYGQF